VDEYRLQNLTPYRASSGISRGKKMFSEVSHHSTVQSGSLLG